MLRSIFFSSVECSKPVAGTSAHCCFGASIEMDKGLILSRGALGSNGVTLIAKTAPEAEDLLPSACGLLLVQRPNKSGFKVRRTSISQQVAFKLRHRDA